MDVVYFNTVGGELDPTAVAARCLSKLVNNRQGRGTIVLSECSFPSTAWLGDLPAGCIREAPRDQKLYKVNDIVCGKDLLECLAYFLGEGAPISKDAAFSAYLNVEFGRCLEYILWGNDAVFDGFTKEVYAETVPNFIFRNFTLTSSDQRSARKQHSGISTMDMCARRLEEVLDRLSRWTLSIDIGQLVGECPEKGDYQNGMINGDVRAPSKRVICEAFGYLAVLFSIPQSRMDRRLRILLQDQRWQGLVDFCRKVESKLEVFGNGKNFLNETIDVPLHHSWFEMWGFGVKSESARDRSDSHDSSSAEPQGYPDEDADPQDYEEPAMRWQRFAFAGIAATIVVGYIATGWNPPFEVQLS
ncbi:hypothetical protein FOL47_009615 [Perkinsus chesapeaki]|uniref:Uncharacterized protein n=1 Tax=Perkinsus chesapeaki TaxID=330153 RepID=A0A7J6L777_PERCH|nr:hypothetical protein FOL47_009615 [Perkinsus chesapeaki]